MTSLNNVETWLYHLGDVSDARAAEIGATNADLVVTEWADYSGEEAPYSAERIEKMRGADDKLVVSYISIGEAEPYRYYWQADWETEQGRPDWIGEANPEWVDNIRVRYWDADWQQIIFGYAERIVDQGFSGLYLDIVSAYEFWEKGDRAPGIDHRQEMADFIAELRAVVDARVAEVDPGREFVIIGQNALELIEHADYLNAIDGVAKEDLRFYYEYGAAEEFAPWPRSEYTYHLDLLKQAEAAGKASFVVEYVPDGQLSGANKKLKAEAAELGAADIPIYVGATRDLEDIAVQPKAIENGVFDPLGRPTDTTPETPPETGRITGTRRDDVLNGTRAADDIAGLGGDDEIFGKAGGDSLSGGKGLDEIFGQGGKDRINGDAGSDLVEGGSGNDKLYGGKGSDEVFGGVGRDKIIGGAGGDYLEGGGGRDVFKFRAGSGEDEIGDFDGSVDRLDIGAGATYELFQLDQGLYVNFESASDGVLLVGARLEEFSDDWIL